jgi:hypothetical protein
MKEKEQLIIELKMARDRSPNGKVACSVARGLMAKHDVPHGTMASICDELNIRIDACELGCFK